jgi:hypothetical protein
MVLRSEARDREINPRRVAVAGLVFSSPLE